MLLTKTYKHHAVKLHTTRSGVRADANGSDSDEFCDFYIGADGPTEWTSEEAKNIWDQITKEFPFFPELHRIFVAHPNVTPIAVTTGVGPHGKKTLHLQPLDEPQESQVEFTGLDMSQIQTLQDALNYAQTQVPTESVAGGSNTMASSQISAEKENLFSKLQTPLNKKSPKTSSLSQENLFKAKENIHKVSKKCTIEDTLFEIQKYINFNSLLSGFTYLIDREMNLKTQGLHLEEFKQGIWTAEDYHEQIALLNGDGNIPPAKKAHQYSPDWDENLNF
ncbi:hypothetical protein J3A83DRAFT_4380489 [Scleroderma citrinum]